MDVSEWFDNDGIGFEEGIVEHVSAEPETRDDSNSECDVPGVAEAKFCPFSNSEGVETFEKGLF